MSAVEPTRTETTVEIVERPGVDLAMLAGMEDRVELTPFDYRLPWQGPFCAILARTGEASTAARAVGKNRSYCYESRRSDPVFAAGWKEAEEVANDLLAQVAWRRGTVGEEVVVTRTTRRFKENELVEETVVEERSNRRSDALLMFMMKARMPHIFRETFDHRVGGPDGGPVKLEVARFPDRERVAALAALWAEEQGFLHPDVNGSVASGPAAA